jgi:hypothetical protein
MIVEVFKTNVNQIELCPTLIGQVLACYPKSKVNFDIEDCDKILRVEAEHIIPEKIIEILNANGYSCEVLV